MHRSSRSTHDTPFATLSTNAMLALALAPFLLYAAPRIQVEGQPCIHCGNPEPLSWTHHPKRTCPECGEIALAFSDLCAVCHIEATMTPDELAEARGVR